MPIVVRRLLAVLVAHLALLPAPAAEGPSARPGAEGHRRMLDLLAEVARQSEMDNPFLGERQNVELKAALARLPEGPDHRRWLYHRLLGQHELRVGRTDSAIEHYLRASELLGTYRDEITPLDALTSVYELGVAYMRLGEERNCALRHTSDSCILPIRGGGVHVDKEGSEKAVHYFSQVLARTPPEAQLYLRARWLINIAAMTLGRHPDAVPGPHRIELDTFRSDVDFPRFVDVAPLLGVNTFDLAGGAIGEDFNGDGFLDIMVSSNDPVGQMRYYESDGKGGFRERTREAGLIGLTGGLNMSGADYNDDGHADVLVLRGGWWKENGRHPNSLLRNNGDGTFTDVTFDAGLGDVHYPTQTAAWADYDNDGDLDLYVGNEVSEKVPAKGQLFRNRGDGTFTDVAEQAGVDNQGYAKGVAWGDYDGDRFPDLFVSNMDRQNRLYHNNGDGTFTDVAIEAGVITPITGFATWFWDYDNDGALDLFVASYGGPNVSPDVGSVAAGYLGLPHRHELDRLYRGDGRGKFESVEVRSGLTKVTLPMGSNYGDLNNDGYLDYYLGTGYPRYEALMPNVMYLNRGGVSFADVTTVGGFGHLQKGHGVVFADLDNDGDQDVFEQVGGQYPGDAFGNALFENPGFGNHWIKLDLVGTRSNRSGVGVRIRVEIDDGGRRRAIHRTVSTGGSFGVNPRRQEIGLGRAERIALLEIYWPTSGRRQRFRDVGVDRWFRVVEDRDELTELTLRPIPFAK
jgi:hypothetical protein